MKEANVQRHLVMPADRAKANNSRFLSRKTVGTAMLAGFLLKKH